MKSQLEKEAELKAESLSLVTRQINDVNQKRRDLDQKKEGIMTAKQGHLRELVDKDLRGLEMMYQAQMTKKHAFQWEVQQATREMEQQEANLENDLMLLEMDEEAW